MGTSKSNQIKDHVSITMNDNYCLDVHYFSKVSLIVVEYRIQGQKIWMNPPSNDFNRIT